MVSKPVNEAPGSGVLLVVSDSQNVAKRIESHLRNAGHPIRAAWVTDLEELEDAINRGAPDVLLCEANLDEAPFEAVIKLSQKIAPDLPVLMMGETLNAADSINSLKSGAQDLVCANEQRFLTHLELVCMREFMHHSHLRELRRTRMQLADFESRHRLMLAGTADAVVHIQEGIIASANPAFAELLGQDDAEALVGEPIMDWVAADGLDATKQALKKLQSGKAERLEISIPLRSLDGEQTAPVDAQLSRGEFAGETAIQLIVRAETEATAATAPAAAAVNREALVTALDALPEAPDPAAVPALMILRIDDFAELEERIGYLDADQLACTAAALVGSRLEKGEQLIRFSTGELALVIQRGDIEGSEALAESLRKELSTQLFKTEEHEAHITVTNTVYPLGAERPGAREIVNELVTKTRKFSADGGNSVHFIGPTAAAEAEDRNEQRQVESIRKAMAENRMKLAFQSIASLEGDTRQFFDIFVRMMDENNQERLAREFLPAAERNNLMVEIDRWVVAKAVKLARKRAAAGNAATFFVRLSEDTLKDCSQFVSWLQELLKDKPLKGDELVFQIQESLIENHVKKARDLTGALRKLNAGVAIDYFGMAKYSAKMLDLIPSSFVKFHFSFTQEFEQPEKQKVMSELLEVARQHKLKTIVAQVEDANVMARLWQMGVNYIQGNSVQEPEVVMMQADVSFA